MSKELKRELRELVSRFDDAAVKCRCEGDEAWDDLNDALGKILIRMEDNWREIVEAYLSRED